MFNEHSLRTDIAKTWGEFGAHIDVFDTMLKTITEREEDEAVESVQVLSAAVLLIMDYRQDGRPFSPEDQLAFIRALVTPAASHNAQDAEEA